MKRIITIFIPILLISACSNNNLNESNQIDPEVTEKDLVGEETNELEESPLNVTEVEEAAIDDEITEVEDPAINDEFTELAEYHALSETINLGENAISIVEDNKGKRVLLIQDENGHEKYKSIFIKHKNRLKIIEFDRGQIFNGVI